LAKAGAAITASTATAAMALGKIMTVTPDISRM
jgi:hypothetical protein